MNIEKYKKCEYVKNRAVKIEAIYIMSIQ